MSSLVDFSNEMADAVARAGQFVIAVHEGGRDGVSGTLWRQGLAITAEHTVRGMDEVTVTLPSGETTKAEVKARDAGTDIALLQISEGTTAISVADEASARVGEFVLAVGRKREEGLAATHGILSAIGGPWRTMHGARVNRWLRLDLNPFPGFSGGPVVNARGEALGMATSGPRRTAAVVPASTVNRVVDELLERGHIGQGYLGVGVQAVGIPAETAKALGVDVEAGLLVVMLEPQGPAHAAGVVLGDILLSGEGQNLTNLRSLQALLDSDNIGKTISLQLVRAGRLQQMQVTVGERPAR